MAKTMKSIMIPTKYPLFALRRIASFSIVLAAVLTSGACSDKSASGPAPAKQESKEGKAEAGQEEKHSQGRLQTFRFLPFPFPINFVMSQQKRRSVLLVAHL